MTALTFNWRAHRSNISANARRWLGVIKAASSSSSGSSTTGHLLFVFFMPQASQTTLDIGCPSH